MLLGSALFVGWAAHNDVDKQVKEKYPSKWADFSGVNGFRKQKEVAVELDNAGDGALKAANDNCGRVSRIAAVLAFISLPIVLLITIVFSKG